MAVEVVRNVSCVLLYLASSRKLSENEFLGINSKPFLGIGEPSGNDIRLVYSTPYSEPKGITIIHFS